MTTTASGSCLQSAAPTHPVDASFEWAHESLFGRLSRRALHRPVTADVFKSELQWCWPQANPLAAVFSATSLHGRQVIEQFRRYLGPIGAGNFDQLLGADLTGTGETSSRIPKELRVFASNLRYCPLCLQHGYHSMLFQHLAVDRCPGHGVPLREECPTCRESMRPTFQSAMCWPFECSKCRALLLKTVAAKDAVQQMRLTDRLIGDWRRDLALEINRGETRACCSNFDVDSLYERPGCAQRQRRLRRMCAWPRVPTPRWTKFMQFERKLSVAESHCEPFVRDEASLGATLANDARKTLMWLVSQCEDYKKQSLDLISVAWLQPQLIMSSDDRKNAVIPVALHATMCQYGMNFGGPRDRDWRSSDIPYRGVCWNGFSAQRFPIDAGEHVGMLLSHEILGYFAIALRRYANPAATAYGEVAGVSRFSPSAYCAAWRMVREGGNLSLQVRPRATQVFVQRLIKRYRKVALGNLVRCDRVASSQAGMAWVRTRWAPQMPMELLHFPAGKACTADPAKQVWQDP